MKCMFIARLDEKRKESWCFIPEQKNQVMFIYTPPLSPFWKKFSITATKNIWQCKDIIRNKNKVHYNNCSDSQDLKSKLVSEGSLPHERLPTRAQAGAGRALGPAARAARSSLLHRWEPPLTGITSPSTKQPSKNARETPTLKIIVNHSLLHHTCTECFCVVPTRFSYTAA